MLLKVALCFTEITYIVQTLVHIEKTKQISTPKLIQFQSVTPAIIKDLLMFKASKTPAENLQIFTF